MSVNDYFFQTRISQSPKVNGIGLAIPIIIYPTVRPTKAVSIYNYPIISTCSPYCIYGLLHKGFDIECTIKTIRLIHQAKPYLVFTF